MAENKSSSNKSSSSSSKSTSSSKGILSWGLNKISFYLLGAVAVLYLLGLIFSACHLSAALVGALQGLATALMICVIAFMGWKYVRSKPMVWKVLYCVFLLVVLVGIIIPLVI